MTSGSNKNRTVELPEVNFNYRTRVVVFSRLTAIIATDFLLARNVSVDLVYHNDIKRGILERERERFTNFTT